MRVGFTTLGCKVAQYETQAIAEEFVRRGATVSEDGEGCDAFVINTCTVTAESDRKCRQAIRRAIAKNPGARVAVIGCYSQRAGEEIAKIKGVYAVLGTDGKMAVVDILTSEAEAEAPAVRVTPLEGARFEPMRVKKFPRARAYVKIEDGCDCRCSYCAISAARGPVRSKPLSDVLEEVRALSGVCEEIVLTGIELCCYGRDLGDGTSLARAITEIDKMGSHRSVRLGSLAPELITEELCQALSESESAVPHYHLSIQSGSDRILGLMRRRYNSDMLRRAAAALRKSSDGWVNFTADLMVGFPTETEEDFLETFRLVSELELLNAHVFAYSKRDGTPAAEMSGQVDESVKRERGARLSREVERVRDTVLDRFVKEGGVHPAILETYLGDGKYSAHTDSYVEIRVGYPEGHEGERISVRPISHSGGIAECEWEK